MTHSFENNTYGTLEVDPPLTFTQGDFFNLRSYLQICACFENTIIFSAFHPRVRGGQI